MINNDALRNQINNDNSENSLTNNISLLKQSLNNSLQQETDFTLENEIIENYEKYLSIGDAEFAKGELEKAEDAYAEALKIVKEKKYLSKQVLVMKTMGDLYLEYSKKGNPEENITKAIALYNAAIVRSESENEKNVLIHRCKYAERIFLESVFKKNISSNLISSYDLDKKHQNTLIELRKICKEKLEQLNENYDPVSEKNDIKREWLYRERAKEIQEIYHFIAGKIKDFICNLQEECESVLGKPLCNYALIGLGSLAREEMTPYSDFEWAILIQEEKESYKQYFYNLAYLLHIKVLNLGETILPSMNIRSLNDYYSEDKSKVWFRDDITPRGFSFDGAMPWASKIPKARNVTIKKPWKVELIATPKQLAQYQLSESGLKEKLKEGYHLATILTNATYIHGEEALLKEYNDLINANLKHTTLNPLLHKIYLKAFLDGKLHNNNVALYNIGQERALNCLWEDNEIYGDFFLENSNVEGRLYQIKSDIYRLSNIFLDSMALYYGVIGGSTLSKIEHLFHKGVLTQEALENLKVAISIPMELRLEAYLKYQKQHDTVTIEDIIEKSEDSNLFDKTSIERGKIARFYATVISLRKRILQQFWKTPIQYWEQAALENLYDNGLYIKSLLYSRLLQYEQAESYLKTLLETENSSYELYLHLSNILQNEGKYHESKNALVKALELISQQKEKLSFKNNFPLVKALIYMNLGCACYALGEYKEQINHQEEALRIFTELNVNNINVILLKINLGNAYGALAEYHQQIKYQEDALVSLKKIPNNSPQLELARVLMSLGNAYSGLGKYDQAIDKYKESLEIAKSLLDIHHPEIALIHMNLGVAYGKVGELSKQKAYLETALRLAENSSDTQPLIVTILTNLGDMYYVLNDFNKQITLQEKALNIARSALGEKHHEVASALITLGNAYYALQKYDKQIPLQEEALKIREDSLGKNHPEVAKVLVDIGNGYGKLGQYRKQMKYYLNAFNIFKEKMGPKHPLTVQTLVNIGGVYRILGDSEKFIEYHEKAKVILEQYNAKDLVTLATIYCNLAVVYENLGNFADASFNYQAAYQMRLKFLKATSDFSSELPKPLKSLALKIAYLSLLQGNTLTAKDYYSKLNYDLNKVKDNMKLAQMYYHKDDVDAAITHYEYAITLGQSIYTEEIYHSLGCLYHVSAQKAKNKGNIEAYHVNLKKAEESFSKAVKSSSSAITKVEYAHFLLAIGNAEEALSYLSQAIALKEDKGKLSYCTIEKHILDRNLQREVKIHKEVIIDASIFAYYLLVKSYKCLGQMQEAQTMLTIFHQEIEALNANAFYYSLLGYAYKELGQYKEASSAFQKAKSLYVATEPNESYILAEKNIDWCKKLYLSYGKSLSLSLNPEKENELNNMVNKIQHCWREFTKRSYCDDINRNL